MTESEGSDDTHGIRPVPSTVCQTHPMSERKPSESSGAAGPPSAEITVTPSDVESRRFGVRVARVGIGDEGRVVADEIRQALADARCDVAIIRSDSDDAATAAELASVAGFRAIHADTLIYWQGVTAGISIDEDAQRFGDADAAAAGALVEEIFADYRNHYTANPLFDASLVAPGYAEWTEHLVRTGGSALTIRADGADVGVSVIDWSPPTPDIKLAGVVAAARGGAHYRPLLLWSAREAARRGFESIMISTQATNVRVMRVWAGLGWKPTRTIETFHLIAEHRLR